MRLSSPLICWGLYTFSCGAQFDGHIMMGTVSSAQYGARCSTGSTQKAVTCLLKSNAQALLLKKHWFSAPIWPTYLAHKSGPPTWLTHLCHVVLQQQPEAWLVE
jgi:hypothetical protein